MEYHVEAQTTLPLCIEHDEVRYADCNAGMAPFALALGVLQSLFQRFIPVNMFVYHLRTSSSLTLGFRALSTTTPSESMNL